MSLGSALSGLLVFKFEPIRPCGMSRSEPSQAKPSLAEPSRAEPSRAEPNQTNKTQSTSCNEPIFSCCEQSHLAVDLVKKCEPMRRPISIKIGAETSHHRSRWAESASSGWVRSSLHYARCGEWMWSIEYCLVSSDTGTRTLHSALFSLLPLHCHCPLSLSKSVQLQ